MCFSPSGLKRGPRCLSLASTLGVLGGGAAALVAYEYFKQPSAAKHSALAAESQAKELAKNVRRSSSSGMGPGVLIACASNPTAVGGPGPRGGAGARAEDPQDSGGAAVSAYASKNLSVDGSRLQCIYHTRPTPLDKTLTRSEASWQTTRCGVVYVCVFFVWA